MWTGHKGAKHSFTCLFFPCSTFPEPTNICGLTYLLERQHVEQPGQVFAVVDLVSDEDASSHVLRLHYTIRRDSAEMGKKLVIAVLVGQSSAPDGQGQPSWSAFTVPYPCDSACLRWRIAQRKYSPPYRQGQFIGGRTFAWDSDRPPPFNLFLKDLDNIDLTLGNIESLGNFLKGEVVHLSSWSDSVILVRISFTGEAAHLIGRETNFYDF